MNEASLIESTKEIFTRFSRVVSAFKTENIQIILFYLTENIKFKVELYNETIDFQYGKILDSANNFNDENSLFFKCIPLKESIGIFIY